MDTELKDNETIIDAPEAEALVDIPADAAVAEVPADAAAGDKRRPSSRDPRRERRNRPNSRQPRAKSEFDQRIINIRRVARVVAGGRRFSFSVAIIVGNRKGKVGVGLGKAGDTSLAIDKAVRNAKKNLITVTITKENSVAHDVSAKYCASRVTLMPVPGRGLVAGSSVRPVLELAGVTNVIAKIHSGSKNGLNNARAAIKALAALKA